MVDGPYLEIHRLERTKRPLDSAQCLVVAHGIGAVHRALGDTRTNDIDAIEGCFGGDFLLPQRELEFCLRNSELEVLGDLVLVDDFSNPHPDLTASLELATRNNLAHLIEFLSSRCNQRLSLVSTQLRKLRIA